MNNVTRWTSYEQFTFRDGVRFAWVAYEATVPGERRCVGVSETSREEAERDRDARRAFVEESDAISRRAALWW